MAEYLPHPHQTIPGDAPQVGQWSKYESESGDLYPAFIIEVGEEAPDGTRFNVRAAKLVDEVLLIGVWQYDVASGRVLWIPKGPPYTP